MTNQAERAWRIQEFLKAIPYKWDKKDDVIARYMCSSGLSRKVLVEYLNALIAGGFVQGDKLIMRVKNENLEK